MSFAFPTLATPVIAAYHDARATWERLAFDPMVGGDRAFGGREYAAYLRADADLAEAIRGAGGELLCGDSCYRLSHKGIQVDRSFPSPPDAGL